MKRILVILAMFCLASALLAQVQRSRTITFDDPNPPDQVTGYHIYWGTTAGGPYSLGKLDLLKGTTTGTVTLPKGTYYFVCTAYNSDNESPYSNEATTTIFDNAMKPINLKIVVGTVP